MKKTLLRQKIALVILGLFLCLALLEIGLQIGGLIFLFTQEQRNKISLKQKGSYRILCLGESTTALGGEDAYPRQLERILNQQNIGITFSVINKGVPGTNTGRIVSSLEGDLEKYAPDLVTAMMGINDNDTRAYKYKEAPGNIKMFFKSLRIYKLFQLLCLHIANKAEEMGIYKSRKTAGMDQNSYMAYLKSGFYYAEEQMDLGNSEEMLKKAIGLNPKSDKAYAGLGWVYWFRGGKGDSDRAEEMLRKAIELNPKSDMAYAGLGWVYWFRRDYDKAEKMLEKAIELNPECNAKDALGWCYKGHQNYDKAKEMFKKAIVLDKTGHEAYLEHLILGWCYQDRREYDKAEEMFKEAIGLNPEQDRAYAALALCYQESGKHKLAEEYFNKANELRGQGNPLTYYNYQKLVEILAKKRVKFVCIQYPMRSIEPLKKIFMFKSKKDIILVDNEKVFKEAVRQAGYEEYFYDMFGGDFGHCTQKGNRLLAQNIANAILKERFNREAPN